MTFCFNQFPSGVGESALKRKRQRQRMGQKERVERERLMTEMDIMSSLMAMTFTRGETDSFKRKITSPCLYLTFRAFLSVSYYIA